MNDEAHTEWDAQSLLNMSMERLIRLAGQSRDVGHGSVLSYSRKVFIPLTQLCRDVCHYCTFAKVPRPNVPAYLSIEQVLDIARAGERAGCVEALFTLGDQPELRYAQAREALDGMGCASTIEYLEKACEAVLKETSLLPHVNPGILSVDDLKRLRRVSVSQGIMLESSAERLCGKGHVHYGSPDKAPAVRLATLRAAGQLRIPFTTGILIGIGETREERLDSLFALRDLHREYGHIQEVIIQNFRAKEGTKAAGNAEPDLDALLWTIACARLLFGPDMNIQAPPNLTPGEYPKLIAAGINDWGGVSPVTLDHVNPEAPWPRLDELRARTASAGKVLVERLPIYPSYALAGGDWLDAPLRPRVLQAMDTQGYARVEAWSPGMSGVTVPSSPTIVQRQLPSPAVIDAIARASSGERLIETEIVALLNARGADQEAVCQAADKLRKEICGDVVSYVVTRNINYTNVCKYRCSFCAFSKGRRSNALRGASYDLAQDEVRRRAVEALERGATEVCMQGGIHPGYTGHTYLELLRAVRDAAPRLHVHAFSPLEVTHGARTLGISIAQFLRQLKDAGLGSLPGTAAEILCDDVRRVICPDKLNTQEWIDVIEAAHHAGLRTTSTIMFGHLERVEHWARHLLALRDLQARTGGITEFVPLPFVHMEAPMFYRGQARRGPTFRETLLMHAVSRLVFHALIPNIQVSWVKLGADGVRACLQAGVNDLGGTLMNESISNAAGAEHGQEMSPAKMEAVIASIGRQARQRTTLYADPPADLVALSRRAAALKPMIVTPAGKRPANAIHIQTVGA